MKKNFSETLKELRLQAGYSQKQVYDLLGIRQSTFSAWETGRAEPSADMLLKLCKLYKVNDIFSAFGYNGYDDNGRIQLNLKEIEHIEKYRSLDPYGQETVDIILDRELHRVQTISSLEQQISPQAIIEVQPSARYYIPYYQKLASAGNGDYLFSDIPTDLISVDDNPLSRSADFVIGVNGNSMEPDFYDGDRVFVKKTEEISIGQIGIFIRGEECFIKELGADRLISHNKNYPDIPADENIRCVGLVLGTVQI